MINVYKGINKNNLIKVEIKINQMIFMFKIRII